MTATFTVKRLGKVNPWEDKPFTDYWVSADDGTEEHWCYTTRKRTSPAPSVGDTIVGHIEERTTKNGKQLKKLVKDQQPTGPQPFKAPSYQRENGDERSRRIERQHSQHMAMLALQGDQTGISRDQYRKTIKDWTDWFQQDLDADVGGEPGGPVNPVASPAADVSAIGDLSERLTNLMKKHFAAEGEEASPAQKRRLTNEFKKVGLVPEVMKAVVMVRCRSEKATKDGASALIQDLVDGATAESLLAEVYDAKRAGDPVGIRAAKLIPPNSPIDEEGLPELDAEGKQTLGIKDESDVPF